MENESSRTFDPVSVPLTTVACIYCVVVYVVLNLAGDNLSWAASARWGYLPDDAVWSGKPWALITSAFVHFDTLHLLFNLYWLWILGSCFEKTLGSVKWLLFFVGAAWVSSAAELFFGGASGIGMSGVGYALFGFGWMARTRMPSFAAIVDDQTVRVFLGWAVLCIVLTQFNVMQIANWAHAFGLAFGVMIALVLVLHRQLWLSAPGLALLLVASFVPLRWCPLSGDWTSQQASQAFDRKDYNAAIYWYRRSLALGQDPQWAWANLAEIYGYQKQQAEYKNALQELEKLDDKAARKVEADYGTAEATSK